MSEWISVKDRLPEHKGYYLVYWQRYGSRDYIEIIYFRGKSRWATANDIITHWMPLPEKPTE